MKCLLIRESFGKPLPAPQEKPSNVHILFPPKKTPEELYLDEVMQAQELLDSGEPKPRKKILTPNGILIFYKARYLQTDIAAESSYRTFREIDIPKELADAAYQIALLRQECVQFYAKNPPLFTQDEGGEYIPVTPDELKKRLLVIDHACMLLDRVFRPMFIELGLINKSPAE